MFWGRFPRYASLNGKNIRIWRELGFLHIIIGHTDKNPGRAGKAIPRYIRGSSYKYDQWFVWRNTPRRDGFRSTALNLSCADKIAISRCCYSGYMRNVELYSVRSTLIARGSGPRIWLIIISPGPGQSSNTLWSSIVPPICSVQPPRNLEIRYILYGMSEQK